MFRPNITASDLSQIKSLAQGGFCVICSCIYQGHHAVLKVPGPHGGEEATEDLLTEIGIYQRISQRGGHPNITHAFGSGFFVNDGEQTPFLVLEWLDGGTLENAFQKSPTSHDVSSNPMDRLPVALELAEAIAFLHYGAIPGGVIMHRDLKPANIGLVGPGHVKLFDLGLSSMKEARTGSNCTYEMSGMAGNKRFMAPEVHNGLAYNEKVDVYAFALLLWQICTLRKPFEGMREMDHFQSVILGGNRPPLDPRWPLPLQNLLRACWHEDPNCRPTIVHAKDTLHKIYVEKLGYAFSA